MIYSNDDPMAVLAMEMERTGSYGEEGHAADMCPVCGVMSPEYYYMNEDEECIGCCECVYRSEVLF